MGAKTKSPAALAWANDQYDDWEYSRMVIMDNTNNMAVGAIRPRLFSDSTRVTRLGRGNTEAAIGETFVYGVGNDWLISNWKSL